MTQTFLFCFFLLLFNTGATAAPAGDGTATTPADLIATPPGAEPAMTPAALKSKLPEDLKAGSPGDGIATTEAKFVDRLLGTEKPKVPEETIHPDTKTMTTKFDSDVFSVSGVGLGSCFHYSVFVANEIEKQ